MDIQRGQRVRLQEAHQKLELRCEIGGVPMADLRVLLLALDTSDHLLDGLVLDASGGRKSCPGVTAEGRGLGFDVELGRVPARVGRLVLVVSVTERARNRGVDASAIRTGAATVASNGEVVAAWRFSASDFGKETALILVEVYRKDGWRLTAAGVGFVGGLPSLVARFHGRIEDIEAPGVPNPIAPPPASVVAAGAGSGARGLRVPHEFPGRQVPTIPAGLIPAIGLVVIDRGEGIATGTGFMITPGGCFLTCAHVVRDAQRITFVAEGTETPREAKVLEVDPDGDLALLHVSDLAGSTSWMVLPSPTAAPTLGDNIALFGYPLGGNLGISLTYSQGVVNSLRRQENVSILQLDAGAAPGSSGGPVFRRSDGHVVGVLTSGLAQQAGGMLVNFAVDARRVYQLGWVSDGH